uniref:Putative secreted protein n=1 Tax=Ixodes ricinus TaxID=34613 RepID=A0A6B0UG89_IXORI
MVSFFLTLWLFLVACRSRSSWDTTVVTSLLFLSCVEEVPRHQRLVDIREGERCRYAANRIIHDLDLCSNWDGGFILSALRESGEARRLHAGARRQRSTRL